MSTNKVNNKNIKKSDPAQPAKKKDLKTQDKKILEAEKLLKKKTDPVTSALNASELSSDDSSDEELLVRTGNVPRNWYNEYDHSGYDINANKVIKPAKEDNIESFLKKAESKNWWRNIYDEMNNKTIFISDKDLELIKRIRKNLFANKNAETDDYFENNVPTIITPLSGKLPWKRSFELSRHERKAINRIRRAIKRGDIKLDEKKENEEDKVYDIWQFENTDPNANVYHPGRGFQAPKRELPDTELSYNPPESYLELNKKELEDNDQIEDEEKESKPEIKIYDALRKIPKYNKLLEENFERCCDLVMSSRFVKKKTDIKVEDILPTLPKPEDLKPFPTKENITYRGHTSFVTALVCDPRGKFLISGDNGGEVFFWDILTAKTIKKLDVADHITSISYNHTLNLVTVCGKEKIFFIIPPFLERKIKSEIMELIENKIKPLIIQKNNEEQEENIDKENPDIAKNADIKKPYEWKIPKPNSEKAKNGIVFYLKWNDGIIKNLNWHCKGDYFAVLSNNAGGKAQIYIHSLSKLIHQKPFSKVKGIINAVLFHPNRPYFIVATNSNIFIYNLQKQEMIRKFVSNLNTITHISIHKNGENLLAGTKDGNVAWFQLDMSDKPFKTMDYHGDKIKNIDYHNSYPLFLSCSRNGKLLVYHATVNDETLQDPVIVPLKSLKTRAENTIHTYSCFHPVHPWIFTCGEDKLIRLWS